LVQKKISVAGMLIAAVATLAAGPCLASVARNPDSVAWDKFYPGRIAVLIKQANATAPDVCQALAQGAVVVSDTRKLEQCFRGLAQ
jgi:hypothetical protein